MGETGRDPYENSKPGEAWNARYSTADHNRCRWPDCHCYAPGGPHECIRAARAKTGSGS